MTDSVKDVDIIATSSDPAALAAAMAELPLIETVHQGGDVGARATTHSGMKIDLKVVEPDQFGNVLQHFTGSKAHNVALRESAVRRGLHVSEYGILDDATGETMRCPTEEEVYATLGLDWIPPELREGRGELEAATPAGGGLPDLIEIGDLRGELHCHTTTSDGKQTAEEMAAAAIERGIEYLAITDHSATHGFGDHVTPDALRARIEEIRALNAQLDGIEPQQLASGEQFYLGATVSQLDRKQAIPVLTPARERLLEYDLIRAVARVGSAGRPKIGLMSALPVLGEKFNPYTRQSAAPWVLANELQRDYDVELVDMTARSIDKDIRVLLLIHPANVTAQTEYALDQFVLRGGKLIAFVDPYAYFDPLPMPPGMPPQVSSSTLPRLFKAWGVSMDPGKVVSDVVFGSGGGARYTPTVLSLNRTAFSRDDIVTSQIETLLYAFGGAAPMHACALAEKLGVRSIVVPPAAGVRSCFGFLASPLAFDVARSRTVRLEDVDLAGLAALLEDLEVRARAPLGLAGVRGDDVAVRRFVEMRYRGQGYELEVPVPPGRPDAAWLAALTALAPSPPRRDAALAAPRPQFLPTIRAELTTVLAGMVLACAQPTEVRG